MTCVPQISKMVEFSTSLHIVKNSPQHMYTNPCTPVPSAEISRTNWFSGLCRMLQKRHWLLRKRKRMRDRKLVAGWQRSLSSHFSLPRSKRPLLAGKIGLFCLQENLLLLGLQILQMSTKSSFIIQPPHT